ncbi:unnamed protein product [Schistosoma curassoni]|uniref:Smr domain-containing protein n=1 Tax=Schistosoma curassoni TaxID=6186 RepID=A0A183JVL9_9TREM|nr:unnamed protein product [Schistosoma curassoni]
MWETGRAKEIATEMKRYNLTMLGIGGTHCTQDGQKREGTKEMMLFSDHEEENSPPTQKVGLMLSEEARKALIGWESHGSRIIRVSF